MGTSDVFSSPAVLVTYNKPTDPTAAGLYSEWSPFMLFCSWSVSAHGLSKREKSKKDVVRMWCAKESKSGPSSSPKTKCTHWRQFQDRGVSASSTISWRMTAVMFLSQTQSTMLPCRKVATFVMWAKKRRQTQRK